MLALCGECFVRADALLSIEQTVGIKITDASTIIAEPGVQCTIAPAKSKRDVSQAGEFQEKFASATSATNPDGIALPTALYKSICGGPVIFPIPIVTIATSVPVSII